MFGVNGTFRDTGARLKHIENLRAPESCTTEKDLMSMCQEVENGSRQLVKTNDIFTNTNRSELNSIKKRNQDSMVLPNTEAFARR